MKRIFLLFCFFTTALFAKETSFEFTKEQAAEYNKSTSSQMEAIVATMGESFFVNAHRILDVGCGDGKITALLAKKLPQSSIVGCDVSKEMIRFALKQYGSSEYPNLSFVEKNACKLGYNEEFDRIFSFNCLHWIVDQQKALQNMYTSLKPSGQAFLIACTKSEADDLQAVCSNLITSDEWVFYFQDYPKIHSFHTDEEYKQMLLTAGFTIDQINPSVREIVFEDRAAFEKWVNPVLTPMHHLHKKNHPAFLRDLFAELQKRDCVDEQGKIHLHISQITMLASKNPNLVTAQEK